MTIKEILKYLLEGLAVAAAAFLVPRKSTDITEIICIGFTAAATFMVIDAFAPSISPGLRQGSGFGIGINQVGWGPNENPDEFQMDKEYGKEYDKEDDKDDKDDKEYEKEKEKKEKKGKKEKTEKKEGKETSYLENVPKKERETYKLALSRLPKEARPDEAERVSKMPSKLKQQYLDYFSQDE